MKQDEIIYKNILENMTDGVMTISLDGCIITLNRAAEKILNLKRDDVLDRPFGEVFLTMEGNDAFNQTVLNAVYDEAVTHYSTVSYQTAGKTLTLSVTTSFLASEEGGKKRNVAVIVVFSDRTEVEKLRETEYRLTEEIKAQHVELQKSYLELEEVNTDLQAALRKVHKIRIAATAFIILLFVFMGIVTWMKVHPQKSEYVPSPKIRDGVPVIYTVTPKTLSDSILLRGILKPIKIVNVTSPFAGAVKEKFFEYGETVAKGQLIVRMDTTEIESKYRDAEAAFIKANKNLREVVNWKDSDEMTKATRSLAKAKRSFEETEILFKKGIVSANEYDNEKNNYENELQTFKTAKAKGEGENLKITKLEYENTKVKLADLRSRFNRANIYAPVSGTIILPDPIDKDKKGKAVEKGVSFNQEEILLSIGDTKGVSVTANVDEMEIMKIKKGQDVAITGDAFPGVSLKGKVYHVSSQANVAGSDGGSMKTPSFEIAITVDSLSPNEAEMVRFGMTANMSVLILNKPNTILIPVGAVHLEGNDYVVTVKNKKTKEMEKVKVQTGITTLDSVEIIKGLNSGDEVVLN